MRAHRQLRRGKGPAAGRVLVLAARRFYTQNMLHHAAALTYQSVLSLFPGLLLAVALLGLLGSEATVGELGRELTAHGVDARLVDAITRAAQDAVEARTASAVALVVVVPLALNFAASAFVTATTALNVIVEAEDRRSFLERRRHALGATVVVILLGVGAVIAVFLGGGLADAVLGALGLGETAAAVWAIARVPLAALLAVTAFAWIYYAAPTVANPRWKWISLGAVVAVVVWLVASVGLFAFARNFDTYNTTYGAFATAMLLLAWLWLTNIALLLGAEINAAGRFHEGADRPLTPTGDSPEDAQHRAARERARL